MKGLCESEVTLVCEWSLDELLTDSEILEAVVEGSIRHVDKQFLQRIYFLHEPCETHMVLPSEVFSCFNVASD